MDNSQATTQVRVTHRFRASKEAVFDAWFDKAQIGKWLFATPSGEMVRIAVDAVVGGRFEIVERRNGEEVGHTGSYLLIERPRKLAFSLCVEKVSKAATTVNIEFTGEAESCDVVLTHSGVLWEYASRTEAGWTGIFVKLEDVLKASGG